MSIQEYISLLEAFKLSLADNKSPEKIQVIEQINKTITNLKELYLKNNGISKKIWI